MLHLSIPPPVWLRGDKDPGDQCAGSGYLSSPGTPFQQIRWRRLRFTSKDKPTSTASCQKPNGGSNKYVCVAGGSGWGAQTCCYEMGTLCGDTVSIQCPKSSQG